MYPAFIKKSFRTLSAIAVRKAVNQNEELSTMWESSLKALPNLADHYISGSMCEEESLRLRLLVCSQAIFLKNVIIGQSKNEQKIKNYLDVGDSDGSTRILLRDNMNNFDIDTLGINLQAQAVEKIRQSGLEAECIDAMDLYKKGMSYDIVSVFQTLEHLPDPIGFLKNIHKIVNHRLIISVPLIVKSRVSLWYLRDKWPKDKTPTIENNHIFELSPEDWKKLFLHSGWRIDREWKVRQFPDRSILGQIMKYTWRKISFEGYWFVSLIKDMSFRNRFRIE